MSSGFLSLIKREVSVLVRREALQNFYRCNLFCSIRLTKNEMMRYVFRKGIIENIFQHLPIRLSHLYDA